jgi:hypothetical protein
MATENKADQGKRPAPPHAWKPGQSGNPGGRPRVVADIQALARQHTDAAIRALVAALDSPRERVAAAQALLDRGYGRAPQRTELTGADGGPIQTLTIEDTRAPIDELIAGALAKAQSEKETRH